MAIGVEAPVAGPRVMVVEPAIAGEAGVVGVDDAGQAGAAVPAGSGAEAGSLGRSRGDEQRNDGGRQQKDERPPAVAQAGHVAIATGPYPKTVA